jgi:small subunit ribosomal protein S4e
MAKAHMKRIAAPRTWPIGRKLATFVRRPHPGAQRLEHGMSLQTWLIEVLGLASTAREARSAIRSGAVRVNGTVAKSQDLIVGLFDVISVEGAGDYLITLTEQNRLVARPTAYTSENLSRIEGKHLVRGGRIQYRLFNGRTELSDATYSVGQTVVVKDGKIDRVLPLEIGARVYFTRGASVGQRGSVKQVTDAMIIVTVDGKDIESHRDVFVVITGFAPLEGEA